MQECLFALSQLLTREAFQKIALRRGNGLGRVRGKMAARIFVKICGITNRFDAEAAIAAGADALGFNFWPGSRRYIDPSGAIAWIRRLPDEVDRVAVLVNPGLSQAGSIAEQLDVLQLHGKETATFCRKLGEMSVRLWKAIPASRPHFAMDTFYAERIVLDTATNDSFGGTGMTFPWQWAREFIAANLSQKVILAGGLTPANVAEAIEQARPFGVDVTSGVEAVVGRKDIHKVRDFIAAARSAR